MGWNYTPHLGVAFFRISLTGIYTLGDVCSDQYDSTRLFLPCKNSGSGIKTCLVWLWSCKEPSWGYVLRNTCMSTPSLGSCAGRDLASTALTQPWWIWVSGTPWELPWGRLAVAAVLEVVPEQMRCFPCLCCLAWKLPVKGGPGGDAGPFGTQAGLAEVFKLCICSCFLL